MKNIVFSLILLLGFGRMSAQVIETTEGGDIQQTLNTLFKIYLNLDASEMTK